MAERLCLQLSIQLVMWQQHNAQSVPVFLKWLTYHFARVYTEFSERHFCGWKRLVDETEWPDWVKRSGRL